MNLLIITSSFPYPLQSGGAQAQYNFINALRHEHQIHLVFPVNANNTLAAMTELQTQWPEVVFHPYSYARQLLSPGFLFGKMRRALDLKLRAGSPRFVTHRTLQRYGYVMNADFRHFVEDIIAQHSIELVEIDFYPYLHFVHQLPSSVRKVFIQHEIRYVRNERLLADIELTPSERQLMEAVREEEIADMNCYDHVITLTSVDREELLRSGVRVPVSVSPAAVSSPHRDYKGWDGRILFLGSSTHTPNSDGLRWFLERVAPLVDWKAGGASELCIIGKGWDSMGLPASVGGLKLTYAGFVSNLAGTLPGGLMIVPILSGSGMRMKILEASAMSLPFLTTTVGVEGLDFRNDEACLIADSPEAWAESLTRLMLSEELRRALATEANRVYQSLYSVGALSERRVQILKTIL